MKAINCNEVLKILHSYGRFVFATDDKKFLDMEHEIANLPPVQPERKKGEWIYGENDGQDGWYCSECEFFIPWDYSYYGLNNIDFIRDFHTCPHCDAKMLSYTGKTSAEMRQEGERDDN